MRKRIGHMRQVHRADELILKGWVDRRLNILDAAGGQHGLGAAGFAEQYDPRAIRFEPLDHDADLSPLGALPEVERVTRVDDGCEILLVEGTSPAGAIPRLASAVAAARVEIARPRLEDIFIRIVTGGSAAPETEERLRADLQGVGAQQVTV